MLFGREFGCWFLYVTANRTATTRTCATVATSTGGCYRLIRPPLKRWCWRRNRSSPRRPTSSNQLSSTSWSATSHPWRLSITNLRAPSWRDAAPPCSVKRCHLGPLREYLKCLVNLKSQWFFRTKRNKYCNRTVNPSPKLKHLWLSPSWSVWMHQNWQQSWPLRWSDNCIFLLLTLSVLL